MRVFANLSDHAPEPLLALEEFLHPGEETGRRWARALVRCVLEFLQEFPLLAGEALRRLDLDLDVKVTLLLGAQHRHALRLDAELLAAFGTLRNLHLRLAAIDGRHLDLATERSSGHSDRHAAEEVCAVALEELMRLDGEEYIEVAGRSPAQSRLAFAGKPDTRAVLDAFRDGHRQGALARDPA